MAAETNDKYGTCEFCGEQFKRSVIGGRPVYWQRYCGRPKRCGVQARNKRARDKVKRALAIVAEIEAHNG